MQTNIKIFSPNASRVFAEKVADYLKVTLSEHEERDFEDGEHKIRPLTNVRGADVFIIQSLYTDQKQSVNDKLCRLLFFIGALHDASAARITTVIPYLAYARKDRKTQPRDPVTLRYLAQILESVGTDHIVTIDVHNLAAYQNAFRCHADHLEAASLFISHLKPYLQDERKLTVVSPDVGGEKRAELFRQALVRVLEREVSFAFFEKARALAVLRAGRLVGEVAGNTVVIVDDLISTGKTLSHAAKICKEAGAKKVYAAATHGIFVSPAENILSEEALDRILVTDTIPPFRLSHQLLEKKLDILPASRLFAEAIKRIHEEGSIVDLLTISQQQNAGSSRA
jgi:ribose-phosphate pyrophosphokinase